MFDIDSFGFVQKFLENGVTNGVFPACVAAIGLKDSEPLLFAAGQADIDTRFDIASMTKTLATLPLIFRAIERGDITLYDTLPRYFDNVPADKANITIFELLTHTSKIAPHLYLSEVAGTRDKVVDAILNSKLEDLRDGEPAYSCMGFILLGKILEKIYHEPLDVLSNEWVFKPLHLTRTSFNPTGGNIAPTEFDKETGRLLMGVVHDENARFQGGVSGNAGVFSTIGDVALFCRMLAMNGGGFMSHALLKRAIRNYTAGFDAHRGLGFHLAGTPENFIGDIFPTDSFGHTGFTGTCFAVDPNTGFYAALLTNRVCPTRENMKIARFRRTFHNAVYAGFEKGGR